MIYVAYKHTKAPNGGYGVLGKGIREALKTVEEIELIDPDDPEDGRQPDVVFTYGMPDLIEWKIREYGTKPFHIHYFVWESSELPNDFARDYRIPDVLLTACKYTQRVAKKHGLDAHVWHHAVDDRFLDIERIKNPDTPFTFLHHNAYEFRKGTEVVIDAFTREFGIEEDVRLILKARERKHSIWLVPRKPRTEAEHRIKKEQGMDAFLANMSLGHPLIEEKIGHISDDEMVAMNNEADVFVFPAKGEGWGLPPFEAAAMGIVPIIPNASAFSEWFNPDCMLDVRIQGYINTSPRYPGYMYQASTANLRKKMRWAFENQDKIAQMGVECREYIKENYNWNKIIQDFARLLEKHYGEFVRIHKG